MSPTRTPCAAAVAGQDAVIHLAAKVNVTGPWAAYERTNVGGTRAIVDACRAAGVERLVHVSSPSVSHAGRSLVGVGAAPADPDRARGPYARSKAFAEQLALAADGDGLAVVAIRPHLVWGPGDPQLIARIVARGRAGRLPLIGPGAVLVDTTYVDNAVDALLAALDRAPAAHGQALVVTNGEPRPIRDLLESICAAAGVPGPGRQDPALAGGRRRPGRGGGLEPAPAPAAERGRPAADPVSRRAAVHRALVRPAAHPRGAALAPARSVSTRASPTWRPGSPRPLVPDRGQQRSQVPKISRSWLTSRKPCCWATALAQVSTAGPETSTVRPQLRQTR